MKKISIDELIDKVDSRYSLVTLISKRARQIVSGQDVLVRTVTLKPVCIAIEEFYENLYDPIYETEAQRQLEIATQVKIQENAHGNINCQE